MRQDYISGSSKLHRLRPQGDTSVSIQERLATSERSGATTRRKRRRLPLCTCVGTCTTHTRDTHTHTRRRVGRQADGRTSGSSVSRSLVRSSNEESSRVPVAAQRAQLARDSRSSSTEREPAGAVRVPLRLSVTPRVRSSATRSSRSRLERASN